MKWSHTLIAGGALIVLTNAVALLGAAYNRSDDPESRLQLSQRELQQDRWRDNKDNSGITLTLNWRIEPLRQNDSEPEFYAGNWGNPVWLDKAKMEELGFDVTKLDSVPGNGRRNKELQPKDVLLVLELNAHVYQQELKRIKEYAERAKALQDGNPGAEELKRRAKSAEEHYQRELRDNSRLFVIDAGIDMQKLRATYPDRTRYAIVRGLVKPNIAWEKGGRIGGHVTELHVQHINVPFKYRQVFDKAVSYEVIVAFGKRLEPWITAASRSMAVQ